MKLENERLNLLAQLDNTNLFNDVKIREPVSFKLEREMAKLTQLDSTIDDQVEFCHEFFSNLPEYFDEADLILKRQIIGLIYPEKFIFRDNSNQTETCSHFADVQDWQRFRRK